MQEPAAINGSGDFARTFNVSRETLDRLQVYAGLVRQWQKAVNLVAPSTLPELWGRHFADSAQLAALVPDAAQRHVDLGSGGGFPGLVLAIMRSGRDGARTILVESDQRKAAFLREAARQTGIAVEIVSGRIEKPETQAKVGVVDVVTARALAPLERLFALSVPLCKASPAGSTVGLFLKGRGVEQEIADARLKWRFAHRLVPSLTQVGAFVVEVRDLCPAQKS
jgi:16S rRNA (guanine527-N7)-methyltransferase